MKKNFNAKDHAMKLYDEWKKQEAEEQIVFIRKCIWKVAKKFGYNPENQYGLEFDDYVNITWIIITERFENMNKLIIKIQKRDVEGKTPLSLATLICQSVQAAFEREKRKYKKYTVITSLNKEEQENNRVEIIETVAHSIGSPEETVVLRDTINRILEPMDKTNKMIIKHKYNLRTEEEIGSILNISGPAVHKRIVKIRSELSTAGLY